MPTYKDFLIGSLPTSAWMLDSTTSSEKDLAMTTRAATISVADRSGVPIVSGAERTFTINPYDYIYYPDMNIWSAGNHGNAFSIEFVVKPTTYATAGTMFAPLNGSSPVTNNGISLSGSKLSFKVGNSSVTYEAYTFLGLIGDISHVVATYEQNALSLWVNGVKEHTVSIPAGFAWSHSLTSNAYGTLGQTDSFGLAALAVYKGAIREVDVTKHYRAMLLRDSPVSITAPFKGTTFMINDADRQKSYYFAAPMIDSWDVGELDNLDVIDNRLTLDTIDPPVLNTGTATFSNSKLALSSSQCLRISDAEKHIGPLSGAVGTYVRYTAARHGAIVGGEYCIMSLFNSDKTTIIQLLEKSDKKIYLRYTSGQTTIDSLLTSPSTGVDSDNYAYVVFSSTEITAYWNDSLTSTSIGINAEDNIVSPQFGEGSSIIIGASSDETNFWGSSFWWVNLWKTPRSIEGLADFKNEIYQYTLKLMSSLNVSQVGAATFILDTGYDGSATDADTISQSRIWWEPMAPVSKMLIESSTTGEGLDLTTYPSEYIDDYGSSQGGFSGAENMLPIEGAGAGAAVPTTIYVRVTLATDDSVNDVVFLKKLGVDIFDNADVLGENSQDALIFSAEPSVKYNVESVATQSLYHGARIDSASTACKIYSSQGNSPVSDNTDLSEAYSGSIAPATKLSSGKTIEFWARPLSTSSGIMFKYAGVTEHILKYNGSGRYFQMSGFDKLFIDGFQVQMSQQSGDSSVYTTATDYTDPDDLYTANVGGGINILQSSPRDTYFNNKWHYFVLVKQDAVNYTDETVFAAAAGSPTLSVDSSKFYYGEKAFKLTSNASAGWITVYNSLLNINTSSGQTNTLSFFVYPDAGITSISTNYRYNNTDSIQTHTNLVPEKWNLVTRTFTNAANLTSIDIRIGTAMPSQTIWIDDVSLVKGTDAFVKFLDSDAESSWFGYDVASGGTQQAIFDLQNPTFYRQSLTSWDIMNNYYMYTGDSARALASPSVKNYLPNGSFEDGTTGYGTNIIGWTQASIDKSSTRSIFGNYSCRVVLPTTASGATGLRTDAVTGLVVGNRYTVSVYIYVPSATTSGFRLADAYGTASSEWQYIDTTFSSNIKDRWVRLFGSFTYTGGNLYLAVTGTGTATTSGQSLWIDGFMLEDGERVTEFAAGGNLLPATDGEYVVTQPTAVLNRNLEPDHPDAVVFTTNPVYLSYAWQILSSN